MQQAEAAYEIGINRVQYVVLAFLRLRKCWKALLKNSWETEGFMKTEYDQRVAAFVRSEVKIV